MAGEMVMEEARKNKVPILPIDSEHSAIFQLLQGQQKKALRRIILTASGGPFWNRPLRRTKKITGKEALNHPNWKMGPKITIDSATLMNKGLEVIEAGWLFQVSLDQVAVLIHPQSIVHSLVEFQDGSILAQMGLPDMMIPIAYALSYPKRLPLDGPALDLVQLSGLTFYQPDLNKFPCLKLALEAGKAGGSLPAVLNAANEIAVSAFLEGRLDFQDIPVVIQETLSGHIKIRPRNIEDILAVDHWARRQAKSWIRKHHH
jgi:1-deoxy-D-xylulose-5-phosphate reductoisomerase